MKPEWLEVRERIVSDPLVCHGAPVVKGTRVMVSVILGALAAGETHETLLKDYPRVTEEDIRACLLFGALIADYRVYDLRDVRGGVLVGQPMIVGGRCRAVTSNIRHSGDMWRLN